MVTSAVLKNDDINKWEKQVISRSRGSFCGCHLEHCSLVLNGCKTLWPEIWRRNHEANTTSPEM